jgi:hypothetical protein
MNQRLFLTSWTCLLSLTMATRAEQGGSAHYLPGTTASFIDAFPGNPGALAVLNYFTYYDASAPANRQFPLGGLLTVAQHLPSLGSIIGVGANGFYYQQISGDSGPDAVLGDFEGHTLGIGPVLSYVRPIGQTQLLTEIKWLPKLDVNKRMEGDFLWFELGFLF